MNTTMESDGRDIVDGVKIAKRGHPGTRHAKKWIPLEPGWTVRDINYPQQIEVSFDQEGARTQ